MVNKTLYNWKSWWRAFNNHNYFVIKFGVSILLVALAFRLLYNRSFEFSPVSDTPFLETSQISLPPSVSVDLKKSADQISPQDSEGKCDLFDGDWIPDKSEPFYTNNSCEFIEKHQNCMKNGRPDRGYLYWRWKPRGCDLARLDPWRFLDLMRNKSWALIGDSISRNHVQSLLCMLSVVKAFIMLLQYILSLLAYTNLVFHAFAMLISASELY